MEENGDLRLPELPSSVGRVLGGFVEAARVALGNELQSIVLYGSAAEGRLRTTSDVNVILILSSFTQTKVDQLREPLRLARAAIQLHAMFLLTKEVHSAANLFADKFADILRRHHILYGTNPFIGLTLSRTAEIARLRQVLLNLTLRLREAYVLRSLREEQLALVIADSAGPLRASAATILELEGRPATSAKDALEQLAATFADAEWQDTLAKLSYAREHGVLPPGTAGPTFFRVLTLAEALRNHAEQLG
ncbi:MAG: hypothetical protein AB7G75_12245 [Candidatus Binatia bacterium]